MSETKVKRVLIFRVGSLGDTVITLPCLHLIERTFPNARRVLITNRPRASRSAASVAILDGSGLIDHHWLFDVGGGKWLDKLILLIKIRLFRPQVLIYLSELGRMPYLYRDRAFFRLAGVRRVYGMGDTESLRPRLDAHAREVESEAARLARTVADLGDAELDKPESWNLRLSPWEHGVAREKLAEIGATPFFACGPGTNRQATDWGRDRWRALFGSLSARFPDYGMVMVGAAEDTALANEIVSDWNGPKLNLCGQLLPRETAAVLERATLYLGPDSGPMHLAAAVGTRCVVPFSARNLPKAWFPFGSDHRILYRQTECAGCRLHVCEDEKLRCLTSISVSDMEHAVLDLMEQGAPVADVLDLRRFA